MSDFDREAEREKLREKYERDRNDREATERMSDLLLKGATMTNAHCGTCGDPIFRHEGQEFCPTCQEVVTDAEDGAADTDQADGDTQDTADAGAAQSSAGTGATAGEETAAEVDAGTATDAAETPDEAERDASGRTPERSPSETAPAGRADAASTPRARPAGRDVSAAPPETEGSSPDAGALGDARASLTRTVTTLARQAEGSEDLERTRAYLAAVEEAADALAAVKRADR